MIHVIAVVEVVAGQREAFLEQLRDNLSNVRAEAGCIEYGPAIDAVTDIPAQIPIRDNVVTVVEKWESLVALKAHLEAPHMHEYRQKVKDMVVGVNLHILKPV